eukprot:TRINITY_DN1925_c0_g1_i1.p1 TRINITY_DN1925_c0_g1~~TRINITY_DN1925_c0_g1_i1.p1  ORF type:complete len:384 (+),score=96.77 TRINITY_DN1925_c0_g1_i1:852-2003(+)
MSFAFFLNYFHIYEWHDNIMSEKEELIKKSSTSELYSMLKEIQKGKDARQVFWTSYLKFSEISEEEYNELVLKGPKITENYDKIEAATAIKGDINRTFAGDEEFSKVVNHSQITRCLFSYLHYTIKNNLENTYVQGFNALAGICIYVFGEIGGFNAFVDVFTKKLRLYSIPGQLGIHAGCEMIDKVLREYKNETYIILQPCLNEMRYILYLQQKSTNKRGGNVGLHQQNNNCMNRIEEDDIMIEPLYALTLKYFITLCSCIRPFSEALKLLDFILALGLSALPIVIASILHCVIDDLDEDKVKNPQRLLGVLLDAQPPFLDSEKIIVVCKGLLNEITEDSDLKDKFFNDLKGHCTNETIARQLIEDGKNRRREMPSPIPNFRH